MGSRLPCPASGFRVTMYDYQAMCKPPTHHHSASQPLVSVSVTPYPAPAGRQPVPFSPGPQGHSQSSPSAPGTQPAPPHQGLIWGPSGRLLWQRNRLQPLSCLVPTFTPSAVHTSSGTPEMPPSVMTGIVRPTVGISQKTQLSAASAAGKGWRRAQGVVSDGAEQGGPGAHSQCVPSPHSPSLPS